MAEDTLTRPEAVETPQTDALLISEPFNTIGIIEVGLDGEYAYGERILDDPHVDQFVDDAGGINFLSTVVGELTQPELERLLDEVSSDTPEEAMTRLVDLGVLLPPAHWYDAPQASTRSPVGNEEEYTGERHDMPDAPVEVEHNWDPNQD